MSKMRVAVLGYGYWGQNLVRNLHKVARCQVAVVADPEIRQLEEAQRDYPGLEVTQGSVDVLSREDVEAVVIATPPRTHYELVKRALESGKHILVEKPLAATVAEAAELMDLAYKKDLTLMVDHTFVYSGAVRKMREIIDSGDLGDIWYVDSVRINLGVFQDNVNVVWDLAPHDLSILDYLIDAHPRTVSAVGLSPASYSGETLEGIAYLTLRYDNDIMAHLHLSWLSPVKIRRMIVGGSRRLLVYDHLEPDHQIKLYDKGVDVDTAGGRRRLLAERREGDMYAPKVDQTEPLERVCHHFIECATTHQRPLTDANSGLKVVSVIEAAMQSMRQGGVAITL